MHAAIERNSWRLPPEDIVQVADPRTKKAQELVLSERGESRNWMSVILSLIVIGGVVSGIITAIYTLGYVDELLYWSGRRMMLGEALGTELKPTRIRPSWVSTTHFLFQADDGGLAVYSTITDNVTRLVSNHTITQLNVKWFQASHDLKYVLLRHNIKQEFRNTFLAHYTIYDVKNDHHIPVRLKGVPKVQQSKVRAAKWCGNTTKIVLVGEDNNIHLINSPVDQSSDVRLTNSGQAGLIYNGVPDWLYQEDIVPDGRESMWCSEDGTMLLYAAYNDTLVRSFRYPWMDNPNSGGEFPSASTLPYPTPGTPNPTVYLWLANLTTPNKPHRQLKPPQVFHDLASHPDILLPIQSSIFYNKKEYYLTSAGWVNGDNKEIVAVWMNRAQNLSVISKCEAPDWQCVESHAERAVENGWVSIKGHPLFSRDGASFLITSRIQEGDIGKFTQIKQITLSEEQRRISVISHGKYQVTDILAWDYINNVVYYLGIDEEKPGQRHVYTVRNPRKGGRSSTSPLSTSKATTPLCLTCHHHGAPYENCTYFTAYLPPPPYTKGVLRYVIECQGPGLPTAAAHSWQNHTLIVPLFSSRPILSQKLSTLALPKQHTIHVQLPHGMGKATAQLLLPPSWREELRDAAFPVLIEVNGKPGHPQVTEKFSIHWGTYMSSQFDVVYVKLDVFDEGSKFVNTRLGGLQIQDYIIVLRHLLERYKYLDKTRIAVWGRGFGGYVTAMVLSSQHHIVKCGIAISPITDWLYYNSAFTERILGLPSENYKEYVEADAVQRSKHIENDALFLIHGLADISVPYVHSVTLAKALTHQGILFRYQSYGDEGHDLNGVLDHLYMSMENYLSSCLSLDKNEQVGL